MQNHPLYLQLKQIALDVDYTVEQARNLTFEQARTLLDGEATFGQGFFENMKTMIISLLQNRDEELDLQKVKNNIKDWLDSNFPNWEIEREKKFNKPVIKVWLKGKP